jgi:cell division protein FtsL
MKLNYREKVILGIFLAVVICIAGFVLLVKPKNQAIKDDKALRESKQAEREEVESKIAEIKKLQDQIDTTYTETTKLTDDFVDYDEIYRTEKFDMFMQHFAEESEVKITALNVGSLGEASMDYYYFEKEIANNDLFTSADLNGDRQDEFDKNNAEGASLSERTVEDIMGADYAVSVTGKKENIWNFMKALAEQDETILIKNVGIADYTFGAEPDSKELQGDEESSVTFTISAYSIYEMAKPNTAE